MQFPSALPPAAFSSSFPLVNTDKIAVGLENSQAKTLPFPPVVQSPAIIESKKRNLPQNPLPTSPSSRPATVVDGNRANKNETRINQGKSIEDILAEGQPPEDDAEDFIPPKITVPDVPIRENPERQQQQALQQIQNQQLIRQLRVRDREVRAHEAAHAAAGAELAGAPSYSYQKGPDGRNYAIGGEVGINTSVVKGDPQATLARSEKIRRAALAPINPSAQDMHIATLATRMAVDARAAITAEKSRALSDEATKETLADTPESDDVAASQGASEDANAPALSGSPDKPQPVPVVSASREQSLNSYSAVATPSPQESIGSYIEKSI
ncbi:MAG: hypothetical protein HRU20_01080 [Pseudomonadales bacterium]|nr:hypothetical protein [Pseudomonadales bacterium]